MIQTMTFHEEGPDFWNEFFDRHPELLKAEYDLKIQNLYKHVMSWYDENLPTLNSDQSTEFLFNKQEVYDREVKRLFLELHPDFATEYREWQSQQNLKVGVSAPMINNM